MKDIAVMVALVCAVLLLFVAGGLQAMKSLAKDINGGEKIARLYSWIQGMAITMALVLAGIALYNK